MIQNIIQGMLDGNFSFAIFAEGLVMIALGIMQLRRQKKE